MSQETQNVMKKIFLSKVVLNMGIGKSGDPIEIGKQTLTQITGKKPNVRNAKKSQRDWGVRKGEPIGVAITIRNSDAIELLKKLLAAKENIREVTLFPMNQNAQDLLMGAPSKPSEKQLKELNIKILDKKK